MIDYTLISKDPNNEKSLRMVSDYLLKITERFAIDKFSFISQLCIGKNVLDIGAGEHDIGYFNANWEHAIYKKHAARITAIEIDQELCDFYNSNGYNFKCIDATSDIYLGEKFDFIYCGDVIEHVDNPVALTKFISRHLNEDGICIITTPNPCFNIFKKIAQQRNDLYFMSNLQHISWIVPTHMLEIIRRVNNNLEFEKILIPETSYQEFMIKGGNIEDYFMDFIYCIRKKSITN